MDSATDGGTDGEIRSYDGRKRRDLFGDHDCVATDALYARDGATILRFSGSSPEKVFAPPASVARATTWTARKDWIAWNELDDAGTSSTLHLFSPEGAHLTRPISSSNPELVSLQICGDSIGWVEGSYIMFEMRGARTDEFRLAALTGGTARVFPSGTYTSVAPFGCAGDESIVLFNDIVSPALLSIGRSKRQLIVRPGEWWLRDAAVEGHSLYLSTDGDTVERLDVTGGKTTPFYSSPRGERLWRVFASSGSVLLPTSDDSGSTPRFSLLELDAVSAAVRKRLSTDREVRAAYRGDGLAWCTDRAVYSVP